MNNKHLDGKKQDYYTLSETPFEGAQVEFEYDDDGIMFSTHDVQLAVEGFFDYLIEWRQENGEPKMSDLLRMKREWFRDVVDGK